MPPVSQESTSRKNECRKDPSDRDEQRGENHKYPADEGRRRLAIALELFRGKDEEQAEHQMKNREKSKQSSYPADDIVENRQQP